MYSTDFSFIKFAKFHILDNSKKYFRIKIKPSKAIKKIHGQRDSKYFLLLFHKKHLRLSDLFEEETNKNYQKQRNLRPTERKLLPE